MASDVDNVLHCQALERHEVPSSFRGWRTLSDADDDSYPSGYNHTPEIHSHMLSRTVAPNPRGRETCSRRSKNIVPVPGNLKAVQAPALPPIFSTLKFNALAVRLWGTHKGGLGP